MTTSDAKQDTQADLDAAELDGLLGSTTDRFRQETRADDVEAGRARIMVRFALFSVGVGANSVTSCYLASVGFYEERLHSKEVFGFQMLVFQGVMLFTIMLQHLYDDHFEQRHGVRTAFGFRIICPGIAQLALAFLMPYCSSPSQVLILGALGSFLSTSQWSTAAQLGSVLLPGGSVMVGAGSMAGSASTVFTAPLVGFGPSSDMRTAIVFYGIGALLTAVGTGIFCFYHMMATDAAETDDSQRQSISGRLSISYQAIEESQELAASSDSQGHTRVSSTMVTVLLFCNTFTSFFATPFFTLATPHQSQALMLRKLGGDAIGRFTALTHSSKYGRTSTVEPWVRSLCVGLSIFKVLPMLYIVHWLQEAGMGVVASDDSRLNLVALFMFSIGSYADGMLNVDAQLLVPDGQRKSVTRANVLSAASGALVAVLAGMSVRHGEDYVR